MEYKIVIPPDMGGTRPCIECPPCQVASSAPHVRWYNYLLALQGQSARSQTGTLIEYAHARYLESMANCVDTIAAEFLLKNDSLEKRTLNGENAPAHSNEVYSGV